MKEISRDDFYDLNADHMAGVSADDREFYRIDDETLGVVTTDREEEIQIRGIVLRPSSDGKYRVDDANYENVRTSDGVERSREKITNWLKDQ